MVDDGTRLAVNVAPLRTLEVTVTDALGLTSEATVDIAVQAVATVTSVRTLYFETSGRSGWGPNEGGKVTEGPTTRTIDLAKAAESQPANFLQMWSVSEFAPSFAVKTSMSGTLSETFERTISTGDVNAALPVTIQVQFPNHVALGAYFTLPTSWQLSPGARFWGETSGSNASISAEMKNVRFHLTAGETTLVDVGPWTLTNEDTIGPLRLDIRPRAFTSMTFDEAFPDGFELPENELETQNNGGWWTKVPGGDFSDSRLAISVLQSTATSQILQDGDISPNLLLSNTVKSTAFSTNLSGTKWDAQYLGIALGLVGIDGDITPYLWGTTRLNWPDSYIDFSWTLFDKETYAKVKLYETFFLDTRGVTATITFENGMQTTFQVGDTPTITLPANADSNGDGRVDFETEYRVQTRFTHFVSWEPRISYHQKVLQVKADSFKYTYDALGNITGAEPHGSASAGPLPGVSGTAGWGTHITSSDSWELGGFQTITTKSTVNVTP